MSDYALHREAMRIVADRLRKPQPVPTPEPKKVEKKVAKKKAKKKKPYKLSDNG